MSAMQALEESGLPKKLRMVVMCNKPSFEFRAFQVASLSVQPLFLYMLNLQPALQ